MLSHFFKFASRVLLRRPLYTLISVLGLAIGLAMAMMSVSYVVREFRWEDCHEKRDRIYRVEMRYHYMDTTWSSARIMAPLGEVIAAEVPGVRRATAFRHLEDVTLYLNQRSYRAGKLIFAGPEFFDVFTFPLKTGDPATCLNDPKSVLITDSIAKQYFPNENPIGKTIGLIDKTEYIITGILENPPVLTQLHCDFIASYSTLTASGMAPDSWTQGDKDLTYLLLDDASNSKTIEANVNGIFSRHVSGDMASRFSFSLKPLKEIYFSTYFSGNRGELSPGGEYDVLIIVIGVGLFILLQSIVNFVSLATARAADRMREIGVRKTFGADRPMLMAQFLSESMLLTALATLLSLPLFDFLRSGYRKVTPDPYELVNLYTEPATLSLIILLAVVVGILAGYYPALHLSRYRPIAALKGQSVAVRSRWTMRSTLLAFQFTLAIFFITVTLCHHNQLRFITNYDLEFERDNMLILQFPEENGQQNCALMKNEILARNDVLGVARSNRVMGTRFSSIVYYPTAERKEEEYLAAKNFVGDYDFLSQYGIRVIRGRGFSPERPEDVGRSLLINESLERELNVGNAVGYTLFTDSASWEIIGVVRDFQGTAIDWSYRSTATISLNPDACRVLSLKLKPDSISASIGSIRNTWNRLFPNRQFEYSFLDDSIRATYWKLDSVARFFGVLSVLSLLIASLGVFGLVSYTVERKTREIAIRKVLGASVVAVSRVLTREFIVVIAVANLVACPLAYIMNVYSLEEYPFRAAFDLRLYLAGGALTAVIAFVTSAFHVIRATKANPTDALRHE